MKEAIVIENVSKLYQLGQLGTGTLREDVSRLFSKNKHAEKSVEKNKSFYGLKDISVSIDSGSAVGIIGKNGAGKSTLLKILSQITLPSSGQIKIKGKVSSLLEVGTGFHPELSGRENIFLNGAILGMSKQEIQRKLDEIIAFSGVDKYIDTPVKRYSSGMYVRLAFAVAAHLETDILIVDEVLAVGDYSFQKKCLGKMGDIASYDGRTVLFVSHNIGAIQTLCNHGLYLKEGKLQDYSNDLSRVVRSYMQADNPDIKSTWTKEKEGRLSPFIDPQNFFVAIDDTFQSVHEEIANTSSIQFVLDFLVETVDESLEICVWVMNEEGQIVFNSTNTDTAPEEWPRFQIGDNRTFFSMPSRFLNEGDYTAYVSSSLTMKEWILRPEDSTISVQFSIRGGLSDSPTWLAKRQGVLAPIFKWKS